MRSQPNKVRQNPMGNLHIFKSSPTGEFPGGPEIRTPCFHCCGPGFNPWMRNKNSTSCHVGVTKKISARNSRVLCLLPLALDNNYQYLKSICHTKQKASLFKKRKTVTELDTQKIREQKRTKKILTSILKVKEIMHSSNNIL